MRSKLIEGIMKQQQMDKGEPGVGRRRAYFEGQGSDEYYQTPKSLWNVEIHWELLSLTFISPAISPLSVVGYYKLIMEKEGLDYLPVEI